METYKQDNGSFPATAEGLNALMTRVATAGPNWRVLLDEVPEDAWGHDFKYTFPGKRDPASFDLDSAGPDGIFGTPDDIHKGTHL